MAGDDGRERKRVSGRSREVVTKMSQFPSDIVGTIPAQPGFELKGTLMVTATPTQITPDEALALLEERLDLSNVRMKLADPREGKGYDLARLDVMEREYRKFLALHLAYPEMAVVPCEPVDEMWHQHILDTAAYRDDCDAIFGRFLDHYPYFGMRDEADARDLDAAYERTVECYVDAFGEPPADTWLMEDAAQGCRRTACKPQKCR